MKGYSLGQDTYIDTDTLLMEVPAGFSVESLPSSIALKSPYGQYSLEVKNTENRILVIRRLEMEKGRFPTPESGAFTDFLRQIAKSDKSKVVLIKPTH